MESLIADGNITLEEAVAPEMFTVAEIGVDPDTYIQVKLRPRSPGATLIVR
jgi:hypothetical protein